MRKTPTLLITVCVTALLLSSCSKEPAPPAAPATVTSPVASNSKTTVAPTARKRASACDIVTQAEMSAILGGTVTAAPGGNDRPPAQTECIYSSSAGTNPYAELEIDWGGGDPQVLGTAAGLATGAAPGAVDPLKGLGDRAYQVTAYQVFISTEGNLMMIRFLPGASDVVSRARKIYETAKSRL